MFILIHMKLIYTREGKGNSRYGVNYGAPMEALTEASGTAESVVG